MTGFAFGWERPRADLTLHHSRESGNPRIVGKYRVFGGFVVLLAFTRGWFVGFLFTATLFDPVVLLEWEMYDDFLEAR